jgi:hypothetical protein
LRAWFSIEAVETVAKNSQPQFGAIFKAHVSEAAISVADFYPAVHDPVPDEEPILDCIERLDGLLCPR